MNELHLEKLRAGHANFLKRKESGAPLPDPFEQLKQHPTSRVYAIKAMCYDCMGRETGWRQEVRNCTSPDCPLFTFRPYK